MIKNNDYLEGITLLRIYPTFLDYWNAIKHKHDFNIEMGYTTRNRARLQEKEKYEWRTELAKTALANGWKDIE